MRRWTEYEKQDLKDGLSNLLKWVLSLAAVVWMTNQVFFVRPAQAATVVPSIKTFSFTDAHGLKKGVASWTEDGVKCTAVSGSNYAAVSVSCVKM